MRQLAPAEKPRDVACHCCDGGQHIEVIIENGVCVCVCVIVLCARNDNCSLYMIEI